MIFLYHFQLPSSKTLCHYYIGFFTCLVKVSQIYFIFIIYGCCKGCYFTDFVLILSFVYMMAIDFFESVLYLAT